MRLDTLGQDELVIALTMKHRAGSVSFRPFLDQILFLIHGELIHRYSFNDEADDAAGATLTDSVGGANGTVLGAGVFFTGTALDLPGGNSNSAAYGDLPNYLISPHAAVTIDAGGNNWGRIFDFGSTQNDGSGGEIIGPGGTNGGGTAGLDYFILIASRGGNYDQQRIEVRNEDPACGGNTTGACRAS